MEDLALNGCLRLTPLEAGRLAVTPPKFRNDKGSTLGVLLPPLWAYILGLAIPLAAYIGPPLDATFGYFSGLKRAPVVPSC